MKALFIIFIISFVTINLHAQINVGEKIRTKTNQRIEQKVDQGIDKALDKTEDGVKDATKKKDKKDKTNENSNGDNATKSDDSKSGDPKPVANDDKPTPLTSNTKYDFVPGDQILLYEDFSQDAVGDFPSLWTTDGSGEVRTVNKASGNWLYMSSDGSAYCLMKDLELPENFIFEFDVIGQPKENDENTDFWFSFYNTDGEFMDNSLYPGTEGFHVSLSNRRWQVTGYRAEQNMTSNSSEIEPLQMGEKQHVIIWVQKRRLRIYHNGQKVIDGPTVLFQGAKYNRLRFDQWGGYGNHFISNLKITTAAPDTRSKLLTEGKLVSYGIYFDSGKDIVKGESYGTLNDIAKVLKENPTVKIKIVGHTDADGDDKSNLDLSKRRAANVKGSLVKDFGIEDSRIETDGAGESQPIAPNDNIENKAKNRRVEFIKM